MRLMPRQSKATSPFLEPARRLASTLRTERERQQITREQLAHRTSLSTATITKIERSETVDPGFFTVARLAEQLSVRLDDLARRATAEMRRGGRR
jgi:transcriptional regulator with XRE-family HTH domain